MADGNLDEIVGGGGGGFFGDIFGLLTNTGYILAGLAVLGICAYLVYYFAYKKKAYNLKCEIKIPRSDGRLVTAEWGRAGYNEKKGVCNIKRKGKKPVAMKLFDPKVYVQGQDIITVLQLSPGHYVPILPDSFLEVVDDKTGEEAVVTKLRANLQESIAWKNTFEREAKAAYSIINLLKEYAPYIGIGIILFMNFAGFAILYSKVA